VARVLIVGAKERAGALAEALREDGHVAVEASPADRGALEHVAIVCWLGDGSPERFLLRAVDTSMRGFLYQRPPNTLPGRSSAQDGDWEARLAEHAARNAIPLAALRSDPAERDAWLAEARAAVRELLEGRYPLLYT
jgi:hypothetical protein